MGRGGRPGPEREGGGLSAPGEAGRGCSGHLHPWHPGRLRAPSLRRSAWPVHASCTARLPPRHLEPQRAATPTVLGGWGQGPRRKGSPSGVAEGVSRTGQGGCRGTLRRDPGGRAGVRSWTTAGNRGLGSSLFFSVSSSPPSPPPDTLPVLRPGHQPNYPAPWASGQSVPGAWPPWLPTSPASVSGQTWKADILFPEWGGNHFIQLMDLPAASSVIESGPLQSSRATGPHQEGGVPLHGNPGRLPGGGSAS